MRDSRVLAARLLDAWIAGDRRRLCYELSLWREGELAAESGDDRWELLLGIVRQMMGEPDLFAPRQQKLHLGIWFDLLAHLAETE